MRAFTGFAGLMALVYAGVAAGGGARPALPKPDLERGKQIATTVCAACHGADGISAATANPHLAGQDGDYIAAQLAAFKSGARPNPIMQGMAAGLTPEDMRSVGAYYEQQKPAPGRGARQGARRSAASRSGAAASRRPRVPACAGCHGAAGPRDAGAVPARSRASTPSSLSAG